MLTMSGLSKVSYTVHHLPLLSNYTGENLNPEVCSASKFRGIYFANNSDGGV